jgi:hypothetical protein
MINTIQGAIYEILYYNNDEFDLSFTVSDVDGNPVDLSGKDLVMTVRKGRGSDAVITITNITVGGVDNNQVTLSGSYSVDERSYRYDLENTTDNITIIYGLFTVTGDVTRYTGESITWGNETILMGDETITFND